MDFLDNVIFREFLFWLGFVGLNALQYLINYVIYFDQSRFLPYITELVENHKLRPTSSINQDFFRYSVEFSLFLIAIRFMDMTPLFWGISGYYLVVLFFNLYQYSFRRIYESEPNFYGDSKLVKNALSIVWHESKLKVLMAFVLLGAFCSAMMIILVGFMSFANNLSLNSSFYIISGLWALTLFWSIHKNGFYTRYPNDLYQRYHFTCAEIVQNILRGRMTRRYARKRVGKQFAVLREKTVFHLKSNPPNLFFIFIESYGSYFFKEASIKEKSNRIFESFSKTLSNNHWSMISNFSESPITGGQSWLTYSSMLNGLRISDNTYFENYLNDPEFQRGNNLLRVLKKSGYINYNLNPIRPMKGINVPYKEMREFYCIDEWILHDNMDYQGDVYGFGECPPDQFSMNYTMDLIRRDKTEPFTFFYLTKNSHSPFIPPVLVENWKDLNHPNGQVHVHKGFLKNPTKEDYQNAMRYEFENLSKFISEHGGENDIFLLMGDHQPPILSNQNEYGLDTPVHVISRNQNFLNHFGEYGFKPNLSDCVAGVKHEAMYSIFLRSFMKEYACDNDSLPEYEPDGIQLQ